MTRPLIDYLGTYWRHLKSGGIYRVTGSCRIEATNTPTLLYRLAFQDGKEIVWARPADEFLDGRFEQLDDPECEHPMWSETYRNRCASGKPPKEVRDHPSKDPTVRWKSAGGGSFVMAKASIAPWIYIDEFQVLEVAPNPDAED